jgi:hypothetical protein
MQEKKNKSKGELFYRKPGNLPVQKHARRQDKIFLFLPFCFTTHTELVVNIHYLEVCY